MSRQGGARTSAWRHRPVVIAKTRRPWNFTGHLRHEVRRVAKAIHAKALAVSRHVERAVSDQSRAEQRRGLDTSLNVGSIRKAEPRVGNRVLGVPTVDVVAGESSVVAQILAPRRAGTRTPRMSMPSHEMPTRSPTSAWVSTATPTPTTSPTILMAGSERQLGMGKLAVDDVQVGATQAACPHLHEDLVLCRYRLRRR